MIVDYSPYFSWGSSQSDCSAVVVANICLSAILLEIVYLSDTKQSLLLVDRPSKLFDRICPASGH